jgi:hypothetical protein
MLRPPTRKFHAVCVWCCLRTSRLSASVSVVSHRLWSRCTDETAQRHRMASVSNEFKSKRALNTVELPLEVVFPKKPPGCRYTHVHRYHCTRSSGARYECTVEFGLESTCSGVSRNIPSSRALCDHGQAPNR